MVEPTENKAWGDKAKLVVKSLTKGTIGAIPYFGSFGVEAFNGVEETKRQREMAVRQAVVEKLSMDIEELNAKLNNDEELAELWDRALTAARSARLERHKFAYTAIMVGAVYADHNDRMKANVLIRLLDQLEEEHLQVIAAIEKETRRNAPPLKDGTSGRPGADPNELKTLLPHLADVLDILLTSLLSLHIIRNVWDGTHGGVAGMRRYALTDTGKALTKILTEPDEQAAEQQTNS
jgi:hypothetical protein